MKSSQLGDRIRKLRTSRGISLNEAANRLGISSSYLSRIERSIDGSPPTEEVISRIAILLADDKDHMLRLAGRIPDDIAKIIIDDASMFALIRACHKRGISAASLLGELIGNKRPCVHARQR